MSILGFLKNCCFKIFNNEILKVHFANNVFLEPIDGVEESLRIRRRLRCIVCKQKRGACLQCSKVD